MTEQILPMEVTRVPTQHITPHPDNARQGNTDLIAQSLEHNGQYRPLVVQKSTGHVLAGNHTLAAAHQLGWTQVAATFIDVDDTAAKKILLADNKTSDEATYDDQLLAQLLSDLDTTHGTGFTDEETDDLLAALEEQPDPTPLTPPPPTPGHAPQHPNPHPAPTQPTNTPQPEDQTSIYRSLENLHTQYEGSDRRSINLFYWGADYIWIVEQLANLANTLGTNSNAETVAALIEQQTNTTQPSKEQK